MAVNKDKTSVLINMDREIKATLEKLAKEEDRSLTGYINHVLKKHIELLQK